MDLEKFVDSVVSELEYVSQEKQLEFLKLRLQGVEDPKIRRVAEVALSQSLSLGAGSVKRPKTVLIMVHGIRTHGVWHYRLRDLAKEVASVSPAMISFGYKDVVTFLLPYFFKSHAIRQVERQIKNLITESPNAKLVLVAHSFGTFIMSRLIEKHPNFQFDRIIFCGSIVDERFPWDELKNFPQNALINDCGTEDVWPSLAKAGCVDYGDSGVSGFNSYKVTNRFHKCKHDGFFTEAFIKEFWLPFISDGEVVQSQWDSQRPPKRWLQSLICLKRGSLVWLTVAIAVVWLSVDYW